MKTIRNRIADRLDDRARYYGPRALVTLCIGSVVWPMLPIGIAYTAGFLGAYGLARVVRSC